MECWRGRGSQLALPVRIACGPDGTKGFVLRRSSKTEEWGERLKTQSLLGAPGSMSVAGVCGWVVGGWLVVGFVGFFNVRTLPRPDCSCLATGSTLLKRQCSYRVAT